MALFLTGVSHKTAGVEVRERLSFARESLPESLRALVDGELVREGMILSTCNRVEVLADVDPARFEEGKAKVFDFLAARGAGSSGQDLGGHIYEHAEGEAVRHLFRVAASLDSMVLGEPQILGQVRQAYADACDAGTAGRTLHRLTHKAFHAAKRVRSETNVAACAVSVSYAAVELGRKILGTLEGRTVLLVGAGEMAELAARHLVKCGASRLLVANRTHETARRLAAEFGGEAVPYERFPAFLAEADICICSTAARSYIITARMARAALELRRNRPSFFIDISVPRNVDPKVSEVTNLFVFDVDDLESVVASNLREREREAVRAAAIVEKEVAEFEKALRDLRIGPIIAALKVKMHAVAAEELRRRRARLGELTPEQERAVEQLLASAVNKISHPLIQRLRRSFETGDGENVRAWRTSFGLEDESKMKAAVRRVLEDAFGPRAATA
ncbi:MAG TPA: glutamyl-tRNA reductase [Pyrinomonadaceae bacterium]|nr:glutamyl-tRNA reductase [Pyrinomonadaceae bacterium]